MILAHILLLELSTRLRSGYALVALGASRKVIVSHSSLFLALLAYTVASSILTYVMGTPRLYPKTMFDTPSFS